MTENATAEALVANVLKVLISMDDITTTEVDETTTALLKEETPFCLVKDDEIYFRSDEEPEHLVFQGKRFGKTNLSPAKRDDFLKAATKGYWIASGKW